MLRCLVAFVAGAVALHGLPSLWPGTALAAIATLALACLRRAPVVAALLLGFAGAQLAGARALAAAWPCARDRMPAEIVGRIAEPPQVRDDRIDLLVDVLESSAAEPAPRRARIAWYAPAAAARPAAGETWHLGVTLRCPRGFANPGAPERELAFRRDGIDATATVRGDGEATRLAVPARLAVQRLRARVADAIVAALPDGASAAVLLGLSVGVRGDVPDALWEAFAVTGTAHLMAISGLHVTGCAVAALALLRAGRRLPALARLPGGVAVDLGLVTAITAGYAVLSGASVPALRTAATVAVFAALRGLRRSMPAGSALALAACLLVAVDPLCATSPGFWLSFVATAALFSLGAAGAGWRGALSGFARAQAAVTVVLAPVLAASFGRLSLVAPLANAVAIPVFGVLLLPAVLAATVLALVAPAASAPLWQALAAGLDRAWPLLERMAAWPGASWSPAQAPAAACAAAVAAGLAATLVPLAGLRIAAGVLVVGVAIAAPPPLAPGTFRLTVADVGQGLAAVVETRRHVLVFDAGPRWRSGGAAARFSLVPLLRARGIRVIDRLLLSHDDADHAGGAEELERHFRVVRRMAAPGSRLPATQPCVAGTGWEWDGVGFRVLHPAAGFGGSDNDRSCALRVAGAGGSALLLADPEAAAEAALARQPIASDVILLPHHGSRHSSSPALVSAVGARLGIASAGFNNRWNMPTPEATARWRDAGAMLRNTAADGAVTVVFGPTPAGLDVQTERRDRPRWWRAPGGR